MRLIACGTSLSAIWLLCSSTTLGAELIQLGSLPGLPRSSAGDVSADGSVVIGRSLVEGSGIRWGEDPVSAFRWTKERGLEDLGVLMGHDLSYARAVSADGTRIIGESWNSNDGSSIGEAFLWTDDGEMEGLGDLPGSLFGSGASDISRDGATVVGRSFDHVDIGGNRTQAFLWREDSGLVPVGFGNSFPNPSDSSAIGVSGDGNRVVGVTKNSNVNSDRAGWVWDASTGEFIDFPPYNGDGGVTNWSISDDGAIVSGVVRNVGENRLFRWTDVDGMVILDGWGTDQRRYATSMSPDGSLIFGWPHEEPDSSFVWNTETGPRDFFDALRIDHGLSSELEQWEWLVVNAVSDDTRVLVGSGQRKDANSPEAYAVFLDRPLIAPMFLTGDYDANGIVDQGDLDLVLLYWGADAAALPEEWVNDLPEGLVDQDELDAVLLGWGNMAAGLGATAVPEPQTAFLLLIGLAAAVTKRNRHRVARRFG